MDDDDRSAVVLVVEDEPGLADLFTEWLRARYQVRTATSGEDALDLYDETVDVVLLDRRMPGLSGDEVLKRIRERSDDCGVAMVTAVEPDFDILDMGFDAYLTKPITREELTEVVGRLYTKAEYDRGLQEFVSLVSKQVALRGEKRRAELEADEGYQRLEERIETLRRSLDDRAASLDVEAFHAVFHDL